MQCNYVTGASQCLERYISINNTHCDLQIKKKRFCINQGDVKCGTAIHFPKPPVMDGNKEWLYRPYSSDHRKCGCSL